MDIQKDIPRILRMSAFEEYMYLDSSAGYPMDCYTRLCWSGKFSHTDLEIALGEALRLHPLLSSRCVAIRGKYPAWQWTDSCEILSDPVCSRVHGVKLIWAEGTCRGAYPAEMKHVMDLTSETPLRIVVLEEKDATGNIVRTDLFFKFHHAVADAIGGNRFIGDLLIFYAQRMGAPSEIWQDYTWADTSLLPKRSWCGKSCWGWIGNYFLSRWKGRRSFGFLFHRVLPLAKRAPREVVQQVDAAYPAMLFHSLSCEQTAHWIQAYRERGGTLNDFLLHASYLALRDWRAEHPEEAFQEHSGTFRIAVPTNLRNAKLANLPAANMVSMVFVDRKPQKIVDSPAFLQGIHREMDDIKRWNLGLLLVRGVMEARNIRILPWAIRAANCWATMVLTNVGKMFDTRHFPFPRNDKGKLVAGNAVLERVDGASPIRPLTCVSLCAMTYCEAIHFTLHYDSRLITEALANDFLTHVLRWMEKLLSAPSSTTT